MSASPAACPVNGSITPFLWFDNQAEEAAQFYTGIFKNGRILGVTRYGESGHEIHQQRAGTVMTVDFELDGRRFTALNGGPHFQFSEAISFQIHCETQEEVDYYWDRLGEGADEAAQQCGWLKDRFGVSWQVVPNIIYRIFTDYQSPGFQRAMDAMLAMKKLDVAALDQAYRGEGQ